ncbi:unnamed protein product [Rotaria sordida]|uniref:Tetratricopeptide repeat protein n=1 Tax=Rotaria sordida TaxID=392033 RepID=A0A818Z7L8_9BILA|nr:unnamed protein product [Rotaria sordida]CAF3766221.1 unnamed protein product [Rotaria sordida]CAF3805635.1 unnamed protein product [Rotaria sordida]
MHIVLDKFDSAIISSEEIKAQDLLKHGKIDQGIAIYQCLKPESARILNIIGILYATKKDDYHSAIIYYYKALKIQEKNGDDMSNTLSELGIAYQILHEFDLALNYHSRALCIRKLAYTIDQTLIANSLLGIANAYWGQQNLTEALNYAQQAVNLNESIETGNELNLSTSLAILANIYYSCGNSYQALEVITRALILLERCVSSDSLILASFLNNLATIQVGIGLFSDAKLNFVKALTICKKSLSEGHPQRQTIENNIKRIIGMEQNNHQNLCSHLWKFSLKTLLT